MVDVAEELRIDRIREFTWWCKYFQDYPSRQRAIPWDDVRPLTGKLRRVLLRSLQDFQLGESSEGRHGKVARRGVRRLALATRTMRKRSGCSSPRRTGMRPTSPDTCGPMASSRSADRGPTSSFAASAGWWAWKLSSPSFSPPS